MVDTNPDGLAVTGMDKPGDKPPMTEADEVGLWQQRVLYSKNDSEQWAKTSGAERFCEEYKGKFRDMSYKNRSGAAVAIAPINHVFAYVQTDLAVMNNRYPYVTVNPTKKATVMAAKIRETWINYKIRELKLQEELDLELMDKDLVGFGWHKTGVQMNSEGTGEQLKIHEQKLYSMRVDWRDVFWNLASKRPPYDCQWMAQRIVRPLDDLKARYPNAANLEGTMDKSIDPKVYGESKYKDDLKYGTMYEIWDARSKRILKIADGLKDKWLEDPVPWPAYFDEFPFLMAADFLVPGEPRPLSAIAPVEEQIKDEMFVMAQAVNHVKRWNRQMIVPQGTFMDENMLDKFEQGIDGSILTTSAKVERDQVIMLDFGQLPADYYMILDRLREIINMTTGQPGIEQGTVTKTQSRTLGELQMVKLGAKSRTDRRVANFQCHLKNIARQMMMHMEGNLDLPEMFQVVDETPDVVIQALGGTFDPLTRTVSFTPEQIKGEFEIDIQAGSTLPLDKQTRMQVLDSILQSLGQAATQGINSAFIREIVMEMLEDFQMKGLEVAFAQDAQAAQAAQQAQAESQQTEDQKVAAETAKRFAQAKEVSANAEVAKQDADIGVLGRVLAERAKVPPKPEPKPAANGKAKE